MGGGELSPGLLFILLQILLAKRLDNPAWRHLSPKNSALAKGRLGWGEHCRTRHGPGLKGMGRAARSEAGSSSTAPTRGAVPIRSLRGRARGRERDGKVNRGRSRRRCPYLPGEDLPGAGPWDPNQDGGLQCNGRSGIRDH